MGAFVRHKFKKGFLLDEERIRKINDILNRRLTDIEGSPRPTYKVYRADAFSYTTPNVQDVVNEENSEWQRITRLAISAVSGDLLNFELDFDDEEGTELNIEGEDRDFVYLFFSDLRVYLSNEVNVLRKGLPKRTGLWVMMVAVMILFGGLLVWLWSLASLMHPRPITTVLESSDVHEKLNFLIESQAERVELLGGRSWFPTFPFIGFVVGTVMFSMILVMSEETVSRMIGFFFPSNVFLFGKEQERYAKRKGLRGRLFWGVFVTSVISILTGLGIWYFTR